MIDAMIVILGARSGWGRRTLWHGAWCTLRRYAAWDSYELLTCSEPHRIEARRASVRTKLTRRFHIDEK